METSSRISARQALKVPTYALFRYDLNLVSEVYHTRTIDGDIFVGGRGKIVFKSKMYEGTILQLAGKK